MEKKTINKKAPTTPKIIAEESTLKEVKKKNNAAPKEEKPKEEVPKAVKSIEKKNPTDVELVDTDCLGEFYDLVGFQLEGSSYKTTIHKKYSHKKKYVIPNPKLITAFIPGTIQKVYVSDGNKVKKNDKLLVLEAMKMKNNLLAPFNGIIKKVHVKQGKLVTKSEILIEFK